MSMYHLVFGGEAAKERGEILLAILGFDNFGAVGRYRDAWVERGADGEPIIAIYTRNGAGNRECWREDEPGSCDGTCTGCIAEEVLPRHPHYLRDQDDEFDGTYATFYFSVPEQWVEPLAEVAGDPVDTSKRWQDAIAAIGGGQ